MFVWTGDRSDPQTNLLFRHYIPFYCYLFGLLTNLFYIPHKTILVLDITCLER